MRNALKRQSGFSLIEIAIVVAVAGLLLSGSIYAYQLAVAVQPTNYTRANFEEIQAAMEKFLALQGRLPCPTQPELLDDHPNAGIEVCDGGFNTYTPYEDGGFGVGYPYDVQAANQAIPACNNAGTSDTGAGLCFVEGRDADGDGALDRILIGSVPYITLGLTFDEAYDGWERRIKYVVSERMTDAGTYDPELGAIFIINPVGITNVSGVDGSITPDYRPPSGLTDSDRDSLNAEFPYPFGSAQFVLMSYGENNVGSYVFTAGAGLANRVTTEYQCDNSMDESSGNFGLDFENCNNDAFFFSSDRYSKHHSATERYYSDDIVHDVYRVYPYSDDSWRYTGRIKGQPGDVKPKGVKTISSSARVGIGVDSPTAALDVNGNVKADKVYTKELCDETDANCFAPKMITGNGTSVCASGGALAGFQNGEPQCANATFAAPPGSCPAGQALVGIVGGAVDCR